MQDDLRLQVLMGGQASVCWRGSARYESRYRIQGTCTRLGQNLTATPQTLESDFSGSFLSQIKINVTIITLLSHLFEIRATLCLVVICTAVQTLDYSYFHSPDLFYSSVSYLIQVDKVEGGSELFVTQVNLQFIKWCSNVLQ